MRVKGPPGHTGRSMYEYDTETRAFYSIRSRRFPTSRRLDVRALLSDPQMAKGFRTHKDGKIFFKGHDIGFDANKRTPRRLTDVRHREMTRPTLKGIPPTIKRYFENISTPGWETVGISVRGDGYTATYRNKRNGKTFQVTTDL